MRSVIVKDDESLHAYAALQEGAHHLCGAISSYGRFAVVVMRDQSAERDTRACVEQGKNSVKDYSTHTFEIDINALGAGFCEEVH